METFIYQLGAWAFATGCTSILFALISVIEGGKEMIFWILFFILYFPLGIIWRLCKNFMK